LSPSVIAEALTALGFLIVAIYFPWRDLNRRANIIGSVLMIIAALWILTHSLEIGIPTASYKAYLMGLQLIWGLLAMSLWLMYIIQYSAPKKWQISRIYALFGIMPLLAIAAVTTNHIYGLMWIATGLNIHNPYLPLEPTYGLFYWVCMIYISALTVYGSFLILKNVVLQHNFRSWEPWTLILAAVIPLLVAILEVTGFIQTTGLTIGITPFFSGIGAIILVWSLPRFHRQKIIPVAYHTVFESIGDCVVVLNMQNRVVDLNPAAEHLVGYTNSEALGLPVEQLWPNWPSQSLSSESASSKYEDLVLTSAGAQRTYNLRIHIIVDSENRPINKVALMVDITESKQTKQELLESKILIDTVIENIPLMLFLKEATDLRFVIFNRAGEELLGYDRKALLGKNNLDLFPAEQAAYFMAKDREVLDGEADMLDIPEEPILTAKKGQRLLHTQKVCIRGADGTTKYLLGISEDITERRQAENALEESEERYRTLFEKATEGIIIADIESRELKYVNPAICKMLGYSQEELTKMSVNDLHFQTFSEQAIVEFDAHSIGKTLSTNIPLLKKDGALIYMDITGTNAIIDGVMCNIGFFTDVTERRQMEEERQKFARLESIGTLAGGIAHDFNNILTGIMGNIGLAKGYNDSGETGECTEVLLEAERASLRAKGLTQQLLTFSKGGVPIKKLTSIENVIEDAANFALRGSNIKCEFSLPDDLWSVKIDQGQIGQVIDNMVINSSQAMPEGGIIQIKAQNIILEEGLIPLPSGIYVQVSVEDHGVGISEKNLVRMFEPYFTTKVKGNGLGLATSYSIIKNHGGHIIVKSKLGIGTTFTIYLPASKEPVPVKDEFVKDIAIHGSGKILVMDDEEVIGILLKKMLANSGYNVELATNGKEAIQKYSEAMEAGKPFAGVILDLTVPGGMGGKEVIKKLLEIDPDVKAIVSSGYSTDQTMSNFKEYGFSGVVAKPYAVGEIEKTLHSILGTKN
jgi:PAS domain S-box-containing protein